MSDRPLHVQVAEALGHKVRQRIGDDGWEMFNRLEGKAAIWDMVPRFHEDWAATGPLIEEHVHSLHYYPSILGFRSKEFWEARGSGDRHVGQATTILEAFCQLILNGGSLSALNE